VLEDAMTDKVINIILKNAQSTLEIAADNIRMSEPLKKVCFFRKNHSLFIKKYNQINFQKIFLKFMLLNRKICAIIYISKF